LTDTLLLTEPTDAVTLIALPEEALFAFKDAVAIPLASVVPWVTVNAPPALAANVTATPDTATLEEFTAVAVMTATVDPSLAIDDALLVTVMVATFELVDPPLPLIVLPAPPPQLATTSAASNVTTDRNIFMRRTPELENPTKLASIQITAVPKNFRGHEYQKLVFVIRLRLRLEQVSEYRQITQHRHLTRRVAMFSFHDAA
jgi:hypothetical protein